MHTLSPRRKAYDRTLRTLLYICAGITCALLVFIIGYIFYRGVPFISWELLSTQSSYINDTIGILPNIANTIYIVVVTLIIILPLGVGAAVYLTEYAKNQKLVAEGAGATPVAAALFGKLHFAALDVARAHGDVGKTVNQCLDAVAGAATRKGDVHIGVGLGESFGSLLNHGQNRRGTVDDQITGKRGGRSSNHRSGKAEFLEHLRFFLHCNSMSEGLHRLPLVVSAPTSTEVRPSKFFLRRFSEPQC